MKKTLLLIPALALALTACNQTNNGTTTPATNDASQVTSLAGEIVYVRIDSLMSNFTMYQELSTAFGEKSSKAETDLTNRGRSLERDMMSAQEKVQKGLVTRLQAAELEEELGRKQQNFVNLRDKLMGELAEEEQVMMNRISNSIEQFMKEFNKDNRYKMVISTSAAGPILIADPALDVTAEAIEGLNAYYAANKESL
ncbi:OmpH family outer membrane protein [Alistipes sp. OttesenSCG-928-L06]|nr:OmpH family outer membrane protein [Alistipes sp. OttesenSCG-928-L06]